MSCSSFALCLYQRLHHGSASSNASLFGILSLRDPMLLVPVLGCRREPDVNSSGYHRIYMADLVATTGESSVGCPPNGDRDT